MMSREPEQLFQRLSEKLPHRQTYHMALIIAGPAKINRAGHQTLSGQVKVHGNAKALQADCCMH